MQPDGFEVSRYTKVADRRGLVARTARIWFTCPGFEVINES